MADVVAKEVANAVLLAESEMEEMTDSMLMVLES